MDVVLTLAGIALIVMGLLDIFHGLLHPSGKGALGHAVLVGAWRLSKATGHRAGSVVGPAAMVAVVLVWVGLQALGWALVYLPHVPGGFSYSPGVDASDYGDLAEALYISLVTLATLGFGDVVAVDPVLRLASPIEALTGFALLTAALTWFTQVYPPLSRRRSLALELKSLADEGWAGSIPQLDPVAAAGVLHTLAAEVDKARIDLTQYNESYYFQEEDPALSLARQLPCTLLLRDAAATAPTADVRLAGARLGGALEQLAHKLRKDFVRSGPSPEEAFAAYAEDHRRHGRR
ncbi:potassium channel family protein [Kocuria sp. M1R5S2]|uniref:potassium channel family protein n=1 Tax=Kocuria rhizosphaerae TaxID=3376285 RepID=UPI0037940C45